MQVNVYFCTYRESLAEENTQSQCKCSGSRGWPVLIEVGMNGGGVRCGFWPRMVIAPSSVMIMRSPSLSLSLRGTVCVWAWVMGWWGESNPNEWSSPAPAPKTESRSYPVTQSAWTVYSGLILPPSFQTGVENEEWLRRNWSNGN